MLEAEVILGHRFSEQIKGLYECDGKLYINLIEQIDATIKEPHHWLNSRETQIERNKILFPAKPSMWMAA